MAKEKKKDPQRCVTSTFRLSFPQLWKAKAFEDQEAKFSATMLFKPDKEGKAPIELRRCVTAAKIDKYGADKSKWPKLRSPFNDGDEKADLDGYKGMIYVNAKNKHRPQVVDLDPTVAITEEDDKVYAGCYCRAAVRAFVYGGKGTPYKPGVAFSLESIQKVRDGERFSGAMAAADVFDEIESEEDDEENYDSEEESDDEDGGF